MGARDGISSRLKFKLRDCQGDEPTEPEMADTETRLVALEQAFYVLVRALEEKKVLEPGDVTKQLHRMEESLRDSRATALADAIREVRKNLD